MVSERSVIILIKMVLQFEEYLGLLVRPVVGMGFKIRNESSKIRAFFFLTVNLLSWGELYKFVLMVCGCCFSSFIGVVVYLAALTIKYTHF